ncbi:hypothetical protein ES703_105762 [subsurface metagenome]
MPQGYQGADTVAEGLGHPAECPGDIEQYAHSSHAYGDGSIARCFGGYHR